MSGKRNLRNIFITLSVLIIFSTSLRAQSPENDPLLKKIPADSLFCIRINNFDNALTQTDQFLAGISPMGISMLARMQLGNILGNPQLTGLNTEGSFTIFGTELSGQQTQPGPMPNVFVGILAPVTNYKQFIDSISSKTPPDENGVISVTLQGMPILSVTQFDNYALLSGPNFQDKIAEFKKQASNDSGVSLISSLDSAEAKLAVTEPIWIYGNMVQVSETFGPLLLGAIEGMKATIGSMPQTNTGIEIESVQNILNLYISIIETLMKEVKSVSLTINPNASALNMTNTITTVPGTKMAKMFASGTSSQGKNNLLPYLDDGAMMNIAAFTMNSPLLEEATDLQVNLLSMMGGSNVSDKDIEKFKSIQKNAMECIEGPVAYTFSLNKNVKPPFYGKYVIALKDEKKFSSLIDETSELMESMDFMNIYKSMGLDSNFTIKRKVDTYKGVSIDLALLSMKATETNTPQAQMIESMYGDGFEYRWGIVNGLFACTIGSDADETIKELIDQVQANQINQLCSEIKAATSLLPQADKADFMMTLNVLRSIDMVSSMMSSSMVPIPIPSIDAQSKSNIVVAGKANEGKLTIDVALPKEHLQEIMTAVIAMQQQMMMQNQPSPGI